MRTIRLVEAIDVRDAAYGETTRLASGGLFIFIGADAETARDLPEERHVAAGNTHGEGIHTDRWHTGDRPASRLRLH